MEPISNNSPLPPVPLQWQESVDQGPEEPLEELLVDKQKRCWVLGRTIFFIYRANINCVGLEATYRGQMWPHDIYLL
jgi:hypothetical protein